MTWGSRFYYSSQFGLYEDDHYRVPVAMAWTWSNFWEYLARIPQSQLRMEGQGRMLHSGLIFGLSFLGEQLGGLSAIYWLGYCIVALNTLLFYYLLKRLSGQAFFATTGAIAFALFPADTTQAFLTHALGVQPGLTLLLVSLHGYSFKTRLRSLLSYCCIFLSLFIYEKFFLVFLAAPLLRRSPPRIRELLRHAAIMGVLLMGVLIARKASGESRVSELDPLAVFKVITDSVLGPVVSVAMFIYRPITGLVSLQTDWFIPLALFFLISVYVLYQTHQTSRDRAADPFTFNDLYRWAIIGLSLLVLAYPLTLIGVVGEISGRGSRVHVAAVVGASILCACACSAIASIATARHKQPLAMLGLSAFFTLLLAFGFTIQRDFVTSWRYQQAFWSDLITLCPDMTADTVILVEQYALKDTQQIMARSPYMNRVLNLIYQFPANWKPFVNESSVFTPTSRTRPPVIYRLQRNWSDPLADDVSGNRLKLTQNTIVYHRLAKATPEVESSNLIVIEARNGQLSRRTEPLPGDGRTFPLKPPDLTIEPPSFEEGILYPYLIRAQGEQPIQYIQ
ncbi:hypothetical protein [Oculatella sp. LEGE 06141]|uniref:hypothetical protein n=1 Tax=Oculatella sp. LEGE 06141 TaxID=1828648 RepID=UPI0030D7460F